MVMPVDPRLQVVVLDRFEGVAAHDGKTPSNIECDVASNLVHFLLDGIETLAELHEILV